MSPRNFARVFRAEIGDHARRATSSACAWRRRGGAWRTPLSRSRAVAAACGFGTPETMRRAFLRALGVAPAEYRRRFHPDGAPSGATRRLRIATRKRRTHHGDRDPAVRPPHRARRDRALRGAQPRCPAPRVSSSRPSRARCAPTTACSRCVAERSLAEVPRARRRARAGRPRRGRARAPAEPLLDWLRDGARDEHVDDVGVHRLAAPRRRRAARGQARHEPLARARRARASWAPSRSSERVVFDGKIVTAAGVSAGIDMALTLAATHRGRRGRAGDPARASSTTRSRPSTRARRAKAPAAIVEGVRAYSRFE